MTKEQLLAMVNSSLTYGLHDNQRKEDVQEILFNNIIEQAYSGTASADSNLFRGHVETSPDLSSVTDPQEDDFVIVTTDGTIWKYENSVWVDTGITASTTGGGAALETQVFLVEELVVAPSFDYSLAVELDLDEAIVIEPTTSGTGVSKKLVTLTIESGSLPTGVTLNTDVESANWSFLEGTPTVESTGTATIRAENPKGYSDFVLNWSVEAIVLLGAATFLNTEEKYVGFGSAVDDFESISFAKVSGITGSINSSYVFTDSTSYAVYSHEYAVASEGFDYAYLMEHTSSSYWYIFKSNVAPDGIVNGLDLADGLSSTGYELSSSDTENFINGGVSYPANQDFGYTTTGNFIDFSNDASFNGFLSGNLDWSFGFRVTEDIPDDFLGRSLFSRNSGNYWAFKYLNATYGGLIAGNSSLPQLNSQSTSIGVISAGSWVVVTSTSMTQKLYVDGSLVATASFNSLNSATLEDLRDVEFGTTQVVNTIYTSYDSKLMHTNYQGLIEDLFITNGTELTSANVTAINLLSDITTYTNYASEVTHAWRLTETIGANFSNLKGGIDGTGSSI